uniref:Uncharacterized protein n=1 Tax=Ditylenchus dipsaci TaxID=166011 RepID=A0A915CVM4_9BILA
MSSKKIPWSSCGFLRWRPPSRKLFYLQHTYFYQPNNTSNSKTDHSGVPEIEDEKTTRPYPSFELQPFCARVAYKCLRFEKTYIRICSASQHLEDLEPLKHLWNGMKLVVEIPTSMTAESVKLVLKSLANKPNQLDYLYLQGLGETATSYQLTSLLNPLTINCKSIYLDGILCEARKVAEYLHCHCCYSKVVILSKNIKIAEEYVSELFKLIKQVRKEFF